ncbi:hypothetical protein PIB30_052470 [Stylosanthes scabra]|uniref:Uncharacterized protein n=1 Tax=Stylosanthes scabra TaxID=79078 RepID=A0ABU6QI59_9FABA|nr:hypothetical protein [Stylosanthes scabra]
MDFSPGRILLWWFNTSDQVCLRFPCPWECFVVIGANRGYIFARCSMDRRTSRIIISNPITNNAHYIADPGSLNYSNNHCISGLAIYSVVPIQKTKNFLIILLHRCSNFDEPYKMQIYESRIDAWYHATETPNPNNFILQQSVAIGCRVYWINSAGEYPHKPLSVMSYSTVDGSWLVGTVRQNYKSAICITVEMSDLHDRLHAKLDAHGASNPPATPFCLVISSDIVNHGDYDRLLTLVYRKRNAFSWNLDGY